MNGVATESEPMAVGSGLGRGMAKLASDVISLTELQWRLLMVDAQQSATECRRALALTIIAVAFAGAGVVVGMGALGFGLATAFSWPIWAGLVIASGLALIAATIGFFIAAGSINKTISVFKRSRDEFTRNVETFKKSLNVGNSDDQF